MKKLLRLPPLVIAGLLFANFAAADSIVSSADTESNTDLQAEIQALFGSSMTWTTASNIAEIDYLLSLVSDQGGDDSLLAAELTVVLGEEDAPADLQPVTEISADTAEPATLVLLGGGLMLFAGCAAKSYGTRQQTHRSGGD